MSEKKLLQAAEPLLTWYESHARILPWREDSSPYRVWVSEIMLQQTRVEAVKPYFERFIRELPTISDLADASEDKILKLWEGLGYYNRVRNMQKAAQILKEEYGGEMPEDYEVIRSLPGIGSYTAGAVSSIAFGMRYPAVDGNVLRVLSRLEKNGDDILKQSVKKRFEEEVQEAIPEGRAGDFNQALIELGAMVCVPNGDPRCGECPLSALCAAHADGTELEYPKKKKAKARRKEERTVLVLISDERAALRKRPDEGLLAGLYELPNLAGRAARQEALEYVKAQGLSPIQIQELPDARHIFSHVEWQMTGYVIKVEDPEEENTAGELFFVGKEEIQKKYSIPSAFGAYTEYFKERQRDRGTDR